MNELPRYTAEMRARGIRRLAVISGEALWCQRQAAAWQQALEGQQGVISIKARGFLVKVACADMSISDHFIVFATAYHKQLSVNFQTWRGENDMNARFGQTLCPQDIRFYIETSL